MTYAIVLDTETTGLDTPHATEIAWLAIDDDLMPTGERFCQRFNPEKPIEIGASKVCHIYDADVAHCPSHTSFRLPAISYLIGQNIHYDCRVLQNAGVDLSGVRTICTKQLAQALLPNLPKHSLSYLLTYFYPNEKDNYAKHSHSALHDVLFTHQVLLKLNDIVKANTLEQLWQASLPSIMPFGKHKGQAIKDLPVSYKRWLLNQDISQNLRTAITKTS